MTQTIDTPVAFDADKFGQTTRPQWESGAEGVLAKALAESGLRDIEVRRVDSPVRLPSATECARFERESFGALHQMMAVMSERERVETWNEIEATLGHFETAQGFVGPCEMLVGAGTK